MAQRLDPNELVSMVELMSTVIYEQEAIRNILEAKGLLSKDEVLDEIRRLRDEAAGKATAH